MRRMRKEDLIEVCLPPLRARAKIVARQASSSTEDGVDKGVPLSPQEDGVDKGVPVSPDPILVPVSPLSQWVPLSSHYEDFTYFLTTGAFESLLGDDPEQSGGISYDKWAYFLQSQHRERGLAAGKSWIRSILGTMRRNTEAVNELHREGLASERIHSSISGSLARKEVTRRREIATEEASSTLQGLLAGRDDRVLVSRAERSIQPHIPLPRG